MISSFSHFRPTIKPYPIWNDNCSFSHFQLFVLCSYVKSPTCTWIKIDSILPIFVAQKTKYYFTRQLFSYRQNISLISMMNTEVEHFFRRIHLRTKANKVSKFSIFIYIFKHKKKNKKKRNQLYFKRIKKQLDISIQKFSHHINIAVCGELSVEQGILSTRVHFAACWRSDKWTKYITRALFPHLVLINSKFTLISIIHNFIRIC